MSSESLLDPATELRWEAALWSVESSLGALEREDVEAGTEGTVGCIKEGTGAKGCWNAHLKSKASDILVSCTCVKTLPLGNRW